MYQSTHQRTVTTCFLGGPRNSSLILCSRTHTTAPTTRKKIAVTPHINGVNGRKNAQAFEFDFLTGATTTSPDSMYGWVKSTTLVRFVTIAMSPMTASKTCRKIYKNQYIFLYIGINILILFSFAAYLLTPRVI